MSYEIFRTAILKKQQVVCTYNGHERHVCPHVIGTKGGKAHVLSFQFGGTSSSGLPPGGEWRCMNFDAIANAKAHEGQWFTDGPHTKPQTCVDRVDVEVSY